MEASFSRTFAASLSRFTCRRAASASSDTARISAAKSAALEGMDALLATVQMPSGIPVAAVAIDGAKNAGFLAVEILAVTDGELSEKLAAHRRRQAEEVLAKDRELNA